MAKWYELPSEEVLAALDDVSTSFRGDLREQLTSALVPRGCCPEAGARVLVGAASTVARSGEPCFLWWEDWSFTLDSRVVEANLVRSVSLADGLAGVFEIEAVHALEAIASRVADVLPPGDGLASEWRRGEDGAPFDEWAHPHHEHRGGMSAFAWSASEAYRQHVVRWLPSGGRLLVLQRETLGPTLWAVLGARLLADGELPYLRR